MFNKMRHKSYFMPQASARSLRWNLENVFGSVKDMGVSSKNNDQDDSGPENMEEILTEDSFRLMNCVTIKCMDGFVELEWLDSTLAGFVADAAAVVLMTLGGSSRGREPHFPSSGISVL